MRSASASLLVLLSVLIARGQMNNPHATPADRAAGSKIFRSHCASCHGVGAFFDGTQVWQIVAFVRSLNQTGTSGSVPGDARRGGQLFRQQGCISCRLARGEGGAKGPDLSVIGSQRSAEHLRESILDPDASVSPEFWVAKIVMNDGSLHSGFVMNQDTYMVQILDFSRGLRSLSRSDFKDFGIDRSSIMPSYKGKLSETELDDLVNYLLSLQRQPGRSE